MKNNILKYTVLAIFLAITPTLSAADYKINGIAYNIISDSPGVYEAEVTSGGSYTGDIIIPRDIYLDGLPYKVVRISNYAFQNKSGLTGISLPASLTEIGEYAFQNCSSLKEISFPASLQTIGNYAFQSCSNLTDITINADLKSIGTKAFDCSNLEKFAVDTANTFFSAFEDGLYNYAQDTILCYPRGKKGVCILSPKTKVILPSTFYDNDNITSVTLPDSLKEIGRETFYSCGNITSIVLPERVKSIGQYAFYQCSNLSDITFSDSLETIGEYAFYECVELSSLSFPDSLKSIGQYAFYNCSSISAIIIPDAVTSVGQYAFSYCSNLKDAELSKNMTRLEYGTFQYCSNLKTIKLKEGLTYLGDYSMQGCGFRSITLPSTISSLNRYSLGNNSQLTDVYFNRADKPSFNNYVFRNCNTPKVHVPAEWSSISYATCEEYTFRDNKGQYEFEIWYKTSDSTVLDPAYTTAFGGVNIVSNTYKDGWGILTFDGMVTSIGDSVFKDCTRLTTIILPDGLSKIGSHAFSGCSNLSECSLPYSLTAIDLGAFSDCKSLKQFSGTHISSDGRCAIFNSVLRAVAPGGLATYSIPDDGSIVAIASGAFSSCQELTEITIPNSITTIGGGALSGCNKLSAINSQHATSDKKALIQDNVLKAIAPAGQTSYTVPESVTGIDRYCFAGLTGLTEINMGSNVTTIGENAFQGCTGLTKAAIPSHVTVLPSYLFKGCTGLTKDTIPANVTSVGEGIFYGCSNLNDITYNAKNATISSNVPAEIASIFPLTATHVRIGDSVQSIPSYLFSNDTGLKVVSIPDSVTSLGEQIFRGCTNLDSIFVTASTPMTCQSNTFSNMGENARIYVPRNIISVYESADGWNSFSSIIFATDIPTEKFCLYYTSTDGKIVTPYNTSAFNSKIFSNTYHDSIGIIAFIDTLKTIGYNAFYNCSNLKSVTIPSTVTEMGSSAFQECHSLENAILPEGLTSIENHAFYFCNVIKSITLPSSVSYIGQQAFYECYALDSVVCLRDVPATINWGVFEYNASNRIIYVPRTAIDAYEQASYWSNYKNYIYAIPDGESHTWEIHYTSSDGKIITPDNYIGAKILSNTYENGTGTWTVDREMTALASNAFNGNDRLTGITLPSTLTAIKESAFNGCSKLDSIILPASLTSIGSSAFYNCDSLKSIILPDSLKTINYQTFYSCDSLKNVTLPTGLQRIEESAFNYCTALKTITLPDSMNYLGHYAFDNCSSLKEVHCKPTTPPSVSGYSWQVYSYFDNNAAGRRIYVSEQSASLYENASGWNRYSSAIYSADGNTSEIRYITTDSLALTFNSQFSDGKVLSNEYNDTIGIITFDRPIKTIYSQAFYKSNTLIGIELPQSVTKIQSSAFYSCDSLETVILPTGLERIEESAFNYCTALKSITLPDSLNYLGYYAFDNCTSLIEVYCKPTTPPQCDSYWRSYFDNNAAGRRFYVPEQSTSKYENAQGWNRYSSDFYSADGNTCEIYYTTTDSAALTLSARFSDAKVLSHVYNDGKGILTLDRPATSLYANAFQNQSTLDSITLPQTVKTIGSNAFQNCTSLADVTLSDSLTQIGSSAFYNCTALTSINLPQTVKTIGSNAFQNCTSLVKVTLPDSLTKIESYVFYSCTKLAGINIPQTVTSIGKEAFYDCDSIKTITLPTGLERIEYRAFYSCNSIESITLPDSVNYLGNEAFNNCTSLNEVICKPVTPPYCDSYWSYIFDSNASGRRFYIPEQSLNSYMNAQGWSTYSSDFYASGNTFEIHYTTADSLAITLNNQFSNAKLLSNVYTDTIGTLTMDRQVTTLNQNAFSGQSTLASIDLPQTITSIGSYAFSNCSALSDIELPQTITSIGNHAFYNCKSLVKVTLPDSLTNIEQGTFYNCTKLSDIGLPKTVKSIGSEAFRNCDSIVSITLPDSITRIENSTFYGCDTLTVIDIPNNVSYIGSSAFRDCKSLVKITLPDSITKIESYTFAGCTAISDIDVPKAVTQINEYAFNSCKSLVKVTLPDSLTRIENNAFSECTALSDITLPNCITFIGGSAFSHCNSLKEIRLPDSLQYISGNTLYECASLAKVTMPQTITRIDGYAFYNCDALSEITLPDSTQSIGDRAFFDCSNLRTIYCTRPVHPSIQWYTFSNIPNDAKIFIPEAYLSDYQQDYNWSQHSSKMCIYSDKTYTLHYTSSDSLIITPYTKPFNAQIISNTCKDGKGTFVLDRPVTTVNSNAFYECSTLTGIELPETVTKISSQAFFRCYGLTGITLPDSLRTIEREAFHYCTKLQKVTLPDSLNYIGYDAFNDCSSLIEVHCKPVVPPTCEYTWYGRFDRNASGRKFFVPEQSITSYENADGWSIYKSDMYIDSDSTYELYYTSIDGKVVTPNNSFNAQILSNEYKDGKGIITFDRPVRTIGSGAFQGKERLATIIIPDSVTSIGDNAFSGCNVLKTCVIPEGVTSIGSYAFNGCYTWQGSTLPSTLTEIGSYAFQSCTSLKSITLPDKVRTIHGYTFNGCNNLKELVADSVTEMESNALYGCGLESFTVPAGITTIRQGVFQSSSVKKIILQKGIRQIESSAFADCGQLEELTLPEGYNKISERMLYNCSALKSIVLPESIDSICDRAFQNCNALNSINLPDSLKYIGKYAFRNCNALTAITLPGKIELIDQYAFSYTSSLASVYCTDSVPTTLAAPNVFEGQNRFFIVPAAAVDTFRNAPIWENFKDYIYPDNYKPFEVHYTTTTGSAMSPNGFYKGNSSTGYSSLTLFYNKYEDGVGTWGFTDTLNWIGNDAFSNSEILESITLPSTVTGIDYRAFYNCKNLQTVTCLAVTPPSLSWSVFDENATTRKILVPTISVSTYETANYWSNYKSSIFSNEYKDEGKYIIAYTAEAAVTPDVSQSDGFGGAKLYSSTFRDGKGVLSFDREVTKIAEKAFAGKAITSITLPDSLTAIASNAFQNCTLLQAIELPSTLITISSSAFEGCTAIEKVTLPASLSSIGANAFNGCTSLDSVVCLRPTPPTCGSGAFDDNAENRYIYVAEQYVNDYDNSWYSYKNYIFANTKEKSIIYYTSNGDATVTPTDVTALGAKVFANTESKDGKRVMQLDRVITTVGVGAFTGQNRLESIILPEGVKSIGAKAFADCMSLSSVTIPSTVTSIGVEAFNECKAMLTVTLPASVTSVGSDAFAECSSLKRVYSKAITPPSCGTGAFDNNTSNRRICVPDTSVATYRKASGWSDYKVYIVSENSQAAQSEDDIVVVETPIIKLYNHVVTITCATTGATIHYTTDGTDPTEDSPVYKEAFSIDKNCTIQAYAIKDACFDSGTALMECEDFIVQMPSISFSNDSIIIECGTDNATIYYTTNGTEPTINSDVYTKPFAISENLTIKAFATRSDYTNSSVTSYTVNEFYTAAPVVTANADNLIEISCATEGAKIYYTTDGTEPTTRSTQYSKPFDPKTNCVVKAIAAHSGLNNSTTTSYQVELYSTAVPVISLMESDGVVKVTITCSTSGSTIRYTVDGTDPDAFSSEYKGTFNREQNGTIKAYATSANLGDSKIATESITSFVVETPTIDTLNHQVVISCTTETSTIYYTIDGTTPTKGSSVYTAPIDIPYNLKVRAIGTRSNFNDSKVASMDIDIYKVNTPSIYYQEGTVTLYCSTPGTSIYYTIDGNNPATGGKLYSEPFTVEKGITIRAIAKLRNYTDSDIALLETYQTDCKKPVISFDGESFRLETDEEVDALYYTTDDTYPTSQSMLYSGGNVHIDGLCTIRAVAVKKGKNNSAAAVLQTTCIFDRENMNATLQQPGTLKQCFDWCDTPLTDSTVTIEGSLDTTDLRFIRESDLFRHLDLSGATIVGNILPDSSFFGSSLVSIILPSTLDGAGKDLFSQCPDIAAVVWDAIQLVPDSAMRGIDNPNFLLYVTSQVLAPSNISNIVSNSNASRITLSSTNGNCNFYAPREFTAYSISYTRTFGQETALSDCSGWETITLPFEVQTVKHITKGAITPFGSTSGSDKHFWLYALSATGFTAETAIQAYRPYLISMPHNDYYASAYDFGGEVTFSATYTVIQETVEENFQLNKKGSFFFHPNFLKKESSEEYLILNVNEKYNDNLPGSVFVSGLRDVKPFEGYVETSDLQGCSGILRLGGDATGLDFTQADIREALTLTTFRCMLRIEANEATTASVYSMDGKLVSRLTLSEGEIVELSLEPGLYMVGSRRVMITD